MKLPGLDVDIYPFEEAAVGDYVIPTITYEEAKLIGSYNPIPDSDLKAVFTNIPTQILKKEQHDCFIAVMSGSGRHSCWWIDSKHCIIIRKKDATSKNFKEVVCYLTLMK